jgi:hypothetical protein
LEDQLEAGSDLNDNDGVETDLEDSADGLEENDEVVINTSGFRKIILTTMTLTTSSAQAETDNNTPPSTRMTLRSRLAIALIWTTALVTTSTTALMAGVTTEMSTLSPTLTAASIAASERGTKSSANVNQSDNEN